MNTFVRSSLFLLVAGLSACRPSQQSQTREYIDAANNLATRYGLAEMPLYTELKEQALVMRRDQLGTEYIPWTDSYWPTVRKGMAQRWGAVLNKDEANRDAEADFALGAFYRTTQVASSQAGVISVNLSPAEKFDLLFQDKRNLAGNDLQQLIVSMEKIDADLARIEADSQLNPSKRIQQKRQLVTKYLGLLNQHSMSGLGFDDLYPMTSEGLRAWLERAQLSFYRFPGEYNEGQDWGWEGLCHGWSIAAVMTDEPRHAVRVQLKESYNREARSLLFTEGDLRGLLTKTWAQAANADMYFIGRRCEQNVANPSLDIEKNSLGRGVGGSFQRGIGGPSPATKFTLVQEYPRNLSNWGLFRIVLEDEWKDSLPQVAFLLQDPSTGSYWLTRDENRAFAAASSGDRTGFEAVRALQFFGCWDVNPASFHTVLVQNLGRDNQGFVMDRTRSGQVWNQPIYKAQFEIGDLVPVTQGDSTLAPDLGAVYHAAGTRYTAAVTAEVFWMSEPSRASFSYTDGTIDRDRRYIESSVYRYVLEFDADQRLIGGEWGAYDSLATDESPDFLFGFRQRVEPRLPAYGPAGYVQGAYDTLIRKLYDCSLKEQVDGVLDLRIIKPWGEPETRAFPYVDCKL